MGSHLSYNIYYNVKITIYNYIKTTSKLSRLVVVTTTVCHFPMQTPLHMWAVSSVGFINTVSKSRQMASASSQTESCPYIIHYFWNVFICFQYSWIYRSKMAQKIMLCYLFSQYSSKKEE